VDAFEQMAGIMMTEGRLEESRRYWHTQLTLAAASDSWGRRLFGAQQLGYLRLRLQSDTAGAVAIVDSLLRRPPLDSVLPGDRPYYELARFFAAAGELARARRMLALAVPNDSVQGLDRRSDRAWAQGAIALAEGNAAAAEPMLEEAAKTNLCVICVLPDLARAYDEQGKTADAIATYERYLGTPWFFRYEVDAFELGPAMKRLGELYDASGRPDRAAAVRSRLLALWRRADAGLQPVLADIRTRVTAPAR
jgi:tetratricopeptide (TPR) repeat protein